MLDKILNDHINGMDALEDRVNKDIEAMILGLDIDAVMENPEQELARVSTVVKGLLEAEYMPESVELGMKLERKVQESIDSKDKIDVIKTDDPKLNEDESDDKIQD